MDLRKQAKKFLHTYIPGFSGAFPYFGTKVYFPRNSWAFYEACRQGVFEQENINTICGLIQPESTYFDIGANIGLMSVPVLQRHPSCTVVSFEPSPNTLPYLLKTQQHAKYEQQWRIINKAVSNREGTSTFYAASVSHSLMDGLKDTRRGGVRHQISVVTTTVDVEWKSLGSPLVSMIKVDVEGAEFQVLEGASECIRSAKPFILLEWNAMNLSAFGLRPDILIAFANEMSYKLLALPNFIPIADEQLLRLNMLRTESFLLVPKSQT